MNASKKYLLKPFQDCINSDEFDTDLNELKILTGPTGFGKTHAMVSKGGQIDQVFDKGMRIVLVSIPDTGIMSAFEKNQCAKNCNAVLANSLLEVWELLDNEDMDRILMIEHASNFKIPMLEEILAVTTDIGMFIDEVHAWMCSHLDNYRHVHGCATPVYNHVLYDFAQLLAEYTPYVFGLTATPTTEQDDDYEGGRVDVMGDLNFRIINKWPTKHDILGRVAYMDDPYMFDIHDEECAIGALYDHLWYVDNHNNRYPTKISGAMWIGADNVSTGYNLDWTLDCIRIYLQELNKFDEYGENSEFAILSSDFKGVLTFHENSNRIDYIPMKEEKVLKKMRSHNDETKHLILKEKGKMGVDVPSIKSILILKATEKKRTEEYGGGGISEAFIQRLGRAFRANLSDDLAKLVAKNGYSFHGVVENLSVRKFKEFMESNRIKVHVPENNIMVIDGLNRVVDLPYSIPFKTAKTKWIEKRNRLTN